MMPYFLSQKAWITTLSCLCSSLPFFFMHQPLVALTVNMAHIGFWLADTTTHPKLRCLQGLITALCLIVVSGGFSLTAQEPWAFTTLLVVSSFVLTLLHLLGRHFGAIGYGSLFLSTCSLLLQESAITWPYAMSYFMLGGLAYHFSHLVASFCLPNIGAIQHLRHAEATLAQKIRLHGRLLTKDVSLQAIFIQTATCRSHIIHSLEQFNHVASTYPRSCCLRMQRLKLMTRRSRLLQISMPVELKIKEPAWLQAILDACEAVASHVEQKPHQPPRFAQLLNSNITDVNPVELSMMRNFIKDLAWIYRQQEQTQGSMDPNDDHVVTERLTTHRFKLSSDRPEVQHACRLSLGMGLSWCITQWFTLPCSAWTLITLILVLKPELSMTWLRLQQRLLGTLAGGAIFTICVWLTSHHGWFYLLLVVGTWGFFHFAVTAYGYAVCCISLLIFAGYWLAGADTLLMLLRLENTLLGLSMALLSCFIGTPAHTQSKFMALFDQLIDEYHALLNLYMQPATTRTLCHTLNKTVAKETALFNLWQNYQLEPNHDPSTAHIMLEITSNTNELLKFFTHHQQLHASRPQITLLQVDAFTAAMRELQNLCMLKPSSATLRRLTKLRRTLVPH